MLKRTGIGGEAYPVCEENNRFVKKRRKKIEHLKKCRTFASTVPVLHTVRTAGGSFFL